MNVSLISETDAAPISVSLSDSQSGARHGLILGPNTDKAVEQILDNAVISGVPIITFVSGEMPWFCGRDSAHILKLSDSPSNASVEALGLELIRTAQAVSSQSERTLLYCEDLSEFLRHERLTGLIGNWLAYGRKVGLSVLLRSSDSDVLQNCTLQIAAPIVPYLSFTLMSNEVGEFLLDDVKSASNASLFEGLPSFEFSPKFIVQFDSADSAKRVAWMLRGECTNLTQVVVPLHNAHDSVLDAVAAIVGSKWFWVKASDSSSLNTSEQ